MRTNKNMPIVKSFEGPKDFSEMFSEDNPKKILDRIYAYAGDSNKDLIFTDENGNVIKYEINEDENYVSITKYDKDGKCLYLHAHVLEKE